MAAIDGGNDTANMANVDAGFNLRTALPGADTPQYVGAVRNFAENDDGGVTGVPLLRSAEVSQDFRQRVGLDTLLFSYTFNATAQNTGIWRHAFSTMTMTQSAGFLNVNAAGTSVGSGQFAYLMSWRQFSLLGTAPLAVEITLQLTMSPSANEVFQAGLGVATGAVEPVDGVWFEITSAGVKGCVRYNSGTVSKIDLLPINDVALSTNSKYVMVIGEREIEFWIDDGHYGTLSVPVAQGQPFLSTSLPLFIQKYNSFTVGSSPNTIVKVGDVTVTLMDLVTSKPWSHQMAGMGLSGQGLDGGTMGANTFYTNSAYPTAALPVNTALTANLPSGIAGGRGLATLWNLAATDMVMSQAFNPGGSVNQAARVMYVTGVTISAVTANAAWTAPAAGQHALLWGLYYGGSSVSMAAVDSASFTTGTTKALRRKFLGIMGWLTGATPIGTPCDNRISVVFNSPIAVNPGENIGLFCQMLNGAAVATGAIMYTYDIDHYFE